MVGHATLVGDSPNYLFLMITFRFQNLCANINCIQNIVKGTLVSETTVQYQP